VDLGSSKHTCRDFRHRPQGRREGDRARRWRRARLDRRRHRHRLIFASEIESVPASPKYAQRAAVDPLGSVSHSPRLSLLHVHLRPIAFFSRWGAREHPGARRHEGLRRQLPVSPGLGLMIWTLIAFGATFLILRKVRVSADRDALDKRRRQIEESIEYAARMRREADELLEEYRRAAARGREQAEDILIRSRKAAEAYEQEAKERSRHEHQEAWSARRREIEAETRRAARRDPQGGPRTLTIIATEKVARKASRRGPEAAHRGALAEVDFSAFASEGDGRNN